MDYALVRREGEDASPFLIVAKDLMGVLADKVLGPLELLAEFPGEI